MDKNLIIGQSSLIDRFKSTLLRGRIVHSYILTGERGVGKKTLANYLSKLLLCTGEDIPCNACNSCIMADSFNHPDINLIKSDSKSLGVEIIRDLRSRVIIKPFQSSWSVYIIEDAHTMTQQAQNAFLKTLEEPPSHVIFFVLADNQDLLLSTIISRCQIIRVPRLSSQDIVKIMETRTKLNHDEALVYASLSEGIPGKALDLALSEDYIFLREESFKIFSKLLKSHDLNPLELVEFFMDKRDKIDIIMDLYLLWLRDMAVLVTCSTKSLLVNKDMINELISLANGFTSKTIQGIIDEVEISKRMLRSHTNFQLTIENLLIKIQGSGEHAGNSWS